MLLWMFKMEPFWRTHILSVKNRIALSNYSIFLKTVHLPKVSCLFGNNLF
jgi:hypothetical protein